MERSKEESEQRRKEQEARDRMDDRLMNVLLRSKARIDRRRKQTEIDLKNEKLRVLEKISQKLESGDAAREEKEQAILQKAIEEKEAINEARRQADIRKQEAFKQQRVADRQQFLRDEEQRLREFNTMRQWEIMNRFKNAEIHNEFKEKLRLQKERKINEYKEDILKLWKERSDREAQERADTRYFYGELAERKLRDADNKLLTHANKLLEEAAKHGRPDFALHKAIDRYCKLYRLYPMPALPASLQEHHPHYAPWDGSAPDPWYEDPPPPGQDAADTGAKRDGMQDEKPASSKPESKKPSKESKPEENVAAYKRIGPANGLQRRNAQTDLLLPSIVTIPCKTEQCRCDLKHK
ncbi:hypothetical protein O3G_MSEX008649 [Manduca sexta]|uniref:Trichohyalin-plectin-homology domain-containing protein n=2 Tax=Manduca sexta TaxID=7130 RepID=A0A922CQR3_MANSE|nr:hypothetical protein O3G_MSEX008649 [Manduca sexta]